MQQGVECHLLAKELGQCHHLDPLYEASLVAVQPWRLQEYSETANAQKRNNNGIESTKTCTVSCWAEAAASVSPSFIHAT